MNPSLRQMCARVAVAETGSFTLAAEYLHAIKSALSGQIIFGHRQRAGWVSNAITDTMAFVGTCAPTARCVSKRLPSAVRTA
jgi:hypothetical protein